MELLLLLLSIFNRTTQCKFYYYLLGDSIAIKLWLRQNGQLTRQLWEKSGNLGNRWRFGQVTVKSDLDFQVVIEGNIICSLYNIFII